MLQTPRGEARKEKTEMQKMPELNSTALPIEKEERLGVYKVTTETEVHEIVTHYHSRKVVGPYHTKD